jgi:hypothetical protein
MADVQNGSLFLSTPENSAADEARTRLQALFDDLRNSNPKALKVQELLAAHPHTSIICPDTRLIADLENAYGFTGVRVYDNLAVSDQVDLTGAIIPGWFRRERMAQLLLPPITQPLTLVLYDIEHRWYEEFSRDRTSVHASRATRRRRSSLFPAIAGWRGSTAASDAETRTPTESLAELESIQDHIRSMYRQRAQRAAESSGEETVVSARLVMFDGDSFAFLRDNYEANVVTHLLDNTILDIEGDNVDLVRKTVTDLRPGDALLFHRRTDRDVIRMTADQELPKGIRDTSSLWQSALKGYVERNGFTSGQLWERLRDAGCDVTHSTIRQWLTDDDRIAPREYMEYLPIIASVTSDELLTRRLNDASYAIREVFGAHQRASHKLAQQVLRHAVDIIKQEKRSSSLIEVESDVVLVRVLEVDSEKSQVRSSIANRLQEPDQWHE